MTRRRQLNMVFAKSFCYWISLCFGSMWILLSVVPSYHHIHRHWKFGNMMESPFVGESRHDIPFYPSYCWLNMVKSQSNIPLVWPDSHWSVESSFFHGIHGGPHWYDPWLKYMGFLVTDFTALEHPWHDFWWHNGCQTNWESSRHSPLNSRHKKSHGQWRIEHILTDLFRYFLRSCRLLPIDKKVHKPMLKVNRCCLNGGLLAEPTPQSRPSKRLAAEIYLKMTCSIVINWTKLKSSNVF